ncbi:MAG TPA: hypothetical protein VM735_11135, partial [Candidatus Kapabacteria bacterium]|nr:hypothetical protein [Candidatus Kapabacteria bacterium]
MRDTRIKSSSEKKAFSKTDVRYWRERLFTRTTDEFHVQISYAGRQERFPLKTANRETAAAKAKEIYLSLHAAGWDATVVRFKPWTVQKAKQAESVTVGDFIEAVRAIAPVRATTFTTYERKFRFLVSQIKAMESSKRKYDYTNGGSKE